MVRSVVAERAEARALEAEADWRDRGVDKWMAYDRASGELVGRGGARSPSSRAATNSKWAGRCAITSAVAGSPPRSAAPGCRLCFESLGADVVVAFTELTNLASRAVMDRLGMRYEREIVHDGLPMVLYTLSRGATVSG